MEFALMVEESHDLEEKEPVRERRLDAPVCWTEQLLVVMKWRSFLLISSEAAYLLRY